MTTEHELQPETFSAVEDPIQLADLQAENELLKRRYAKLERKAGKAMRRRRREQQLKPYQAELLALQHYLEETQQRVIITFDGRDAAGKGGTIRRVTRYMNEKHYRVVALGKPTQMQRTQWYFQKYVEQFPRGGEIVLFDRSWYNRAMVERVFGFCTDDEYHNFMSGVVDFERDLVRQGTILLKLYFSVTKAEQARRFDRRHSDPLRQWKLSEVDLQAQERWEDFTNVKYEMLRQTSTADAPWTIIRSDNKQRARLNAIKVILNMMPFDRLNPNLDLTPDPEIVISGSRELELMRRQWVQLGRFLD